jgi:hypothetical protein
MVTHSLRTSTATRWENEMANVEQSLISQTVSLIALLFPHRGEEELLKGVKKIVKKAREVKMYMSEEKALYYPDWESGGKDFNPLRMQPAGLQKQGKVAFCTAPGLVKLQLQLKEKVPKVIVKASVLLQSDIS